MQPEFEGRRIDWQIADLPAIECDPGLVKQVFTNLLSNAVKYSRGRELAIIEVGTIEQAGVPVFFVRDNGAGFDQRYSSKLFGVFERLHRADEFEGTGVGLSTVQRIVKKHGERSGPRLKWTRARLSFLRLRRRLADGQAGKHEEKD